jgi:sugar O-acyltransferase (sialic acid O-acetyltransferase NeuD family)
MILWGGTGQAKILRPIIEYHGSRVMAVIDDTPGLKSPFGDVEIYHGYKRLKPVIEGHNTEAIGFCIAIGNPRGDVRVKLHEFLVKEGFRPVTVAHPTAWIAGNAVLNSGCQLMAGAIINEEAVIGKECIINTNASVDHECLLEDGVELAPAATLCGCVHVGTNSWIGAGATVLPRLKIGAGVIVGAGAVVTKDIPDGLTVMGVPARPI